MMNISPSIGKILNRYGCDVTVKNGGKSVKTKAFISPLRYNRIMTVYGINWV